EIGVESSIGHGCISPELDKRIAEEMHRCEKPDGLSVFMTPGSTEAEVEGVRAALAATDGVEDVVFVDKEMAYQEFRRLFAESPDFVDSIKPEDLPESFKVSTVVPWPKAELDEIKALPGVRSVEDGTREFNDLCGTSSTGGGGTSNPGSRATTTSGVPNSDGF
ncbi:MAG TPA: permease-like cell division protein FtsX, partial [Microthrixaceae bacterium]|nr:permease-like cell division protein FtsX [Microthrixaceae bacterium]